MKGLPFKPIVAIPVDLFPHTRHCELVLLFQRTEDNDCVTTERDDDRVKSESEDGEAQRDGEAPRLLDNQTLN